MGLVNACTFLLFFTDYRIGMLSIADYAIFFLIVFSFRKENFYIRKYDLLFLVIILVSNVVSMMLNFDKSYFSMYEYSTSLLKLLFYMIGVTIIPRLLIKQEIDLIKISRAIFVLSVVGALIQVLVVKIFGLESWPLYSLGSHWFELNAFDTMTVVGRLDMIRPRSFFSEPAAFTVALSLVFLILIYYDNNKRYQRAYIVIYLIGIFLTQSVSGIGIAVFIVAIYFISVENVEKARRMLGMGTIGIVSLILVLSRSGYVLGRVRNLIDMKDRSGTVRLFGGFKFLENIPWYGVGIGNQKEFYFSLLGLNGDSVYYGGSGEFYNIIVVAIISFGYIGAIALLGFFYYRVQNKKIFISLVAIFFATGRLFTPTFFVFVIFCDVLNKTIETNERSEQLSYMTGGYIDG